MNYNLKNRPRPPNMTIPNPSRLDQCCIEYCDAEGWFEGFEKELREMLEDLEHGKIFPCKLYEEKIIEEILGEGCRFKLKIKEETI